MAVLYFAGAAIVYQLVLIKVFPQAPDLSSIVGAITRSTGSLIRYFMGSTILATLLYSYKVQQPKSTKSDEQASFLSNKESIPNSPNRAT